MTQPQTLAQPATPVRLLVTGASGFIGGHVLAALADSNWEVFGLTVPGSGDLSTATGVHWLEVDLFDRDSAYELVSSLQATHLLHLAWPTAYQEMSQDVDLKGNLRWEEASLRLLRDFAETGGRRVVVAGTCAEYDWNAAGPGGVFSETAPLDGDIPYAIAKVELFRAFEEYCRSSGISGAWGRIFQVYGPGELPRKFVSAVATALLAGKPAKMTHGLQVRDYVYVRDVAEAFITILGSDLEGPVNIGSGTGVRMRDLGREIGSFIGREDLLEFGAIPARADHEDPVIADITRLKQELGWVPRYGLTEGVAETVDWWRGR